MSVDKTIRDALLPFGDPVENSIYQGTAAQYFTFNYSTFGDLHADNAPGYERYLIQVHFICPLSVNPLRRIAEVKQALFEAGTTWPELENATDENGRHYVLECEYSEGLGDGL